MLFWPWIRGRRGPVFACESSCSIAGWFIGGTGGGDEMLDAREWRMEVLNFSKRRHKFSRKNMKRKQATRKHQIIVLNHVLVRNDGGIQKGHEIGITHFFGSAWRVVGAVRYHVRPGSDKEIEFWHGLENASTWVSIQESHTGPASFLAWQAHYDLKDPAGLAGFLIDSDIKLIRAESGAPDDWSRHKSQGDMKRNLGCTKWREDKVSNFRIGFLSLFCLCTPSTQQLKATWKDMGCTKWREDKVSNSRIGFLSLDSFFHTSSRSGIERCRPLLSG